MKVQKKVTIVGLILLFCILSIYYDMIEASSQFYLELGERLLRRGDEGSDVALLQRKLQQSGYYEGEVDGLFGPITERAVINFQKDNNLIIDGIVGPQTLSHLPGGELLSRMSYPRNEIVALARVIYGEARGESFQGKVAVAAVVLNRVASDKFPDNIIDVILETGQFSCIMDGQVNQEFPSKEIFDAARTALLGYDPTKGALFFYNPEIATNLVWISARPVITRIGNHVFAM